MPGVFSYLRSFRHLARTDENDGTLLERFRTQRDEQAFATLVQRHGPLILGIIRRLVGPGDQADDVFQATFLVLARKGQSMERWPSVAGWLVQVARRTALQAQAKSARRLRHEQQAASMISHITTTDPARTMEQQDLANALDAELDKLPGKYRTPIILCQLQGQTREETARQLGWPLGSVAGRLARGKKLLQDRLLKRGIVPTVVAGAMQTPVAQAQIPALLIQATTLLASHVVHKTSQVPASAAITLAQGVMTSMLLTKVKYAAAALLLLSVCVGTGAWAWSGKAEPPVAQAQSSKIEAKASSLLEQLQGTWEVTKLTDGEGDRNISMKEKSYWIFRGNSFVGTRFPFVQPADLWRPFKLDDTVTPIHFEYEFQHPQEKFKQHWKGIIKLENGILTLNLVGDPKLQRPTSFTPGGGAFTYSLRRVTDYDRLEGVWRKEERNPVTNELDSAEEMIFRKNQYVRRVYHSRFPGKVQEEKVTTFLLNESATPKQIDLNIRSADEINEGYAQQLTNRNNREMFANAFLKNNRILERQVGIYELKNNEFTYQISGAVPFVLKGDKLVPDPQSPLNRRPTAFVPGNNATEVWRSLSVTYKRVSKSLKDSLNLSDAPHQEIPAGATQPNPSPDVSPQILELKQQRLKVAEERMDIWKEMFRAGRASLEESGQLSQQLLDARLALAKDSDMKVKSLEEHLKLLKQVEEYAEKGYQSGSRTKSDLLAVKLRRIEVEIQLEEMKAKKITITTTGWAGLQIRSPAKSI